MADYSILSDISKYLAGLLRENMCPELIALPSQIEVSEPGDKNQDYILGIFLYNIEEEKDAVLPRFQQAGRLAIQQMPKPCRIFYMFYINGASQTNYKAVDVQKIMGRTMQILSDNTQVQPNMLQPWLDSMEPLVTLSQHEISLEAKFQIWQAVNQPYQLSLFYQAAPVLLSSHNSKDIVRVSEARFSLENMENRRGP